MLLWLVTRIGGIRKFLGSQMNGPGEMHPQVLRAEAAAVLSGRHVPHLMKSARRAGLLKPEIVDALELAQHPLVLITLRHSADTDAGSA